VPFSAVSSFIYCAPFTGWPSSEVGIKLFAVLYMLNFISHARFYFPIDLMVLPAITFSIAALTGAAPCDSDDGFLFPNSAQLVTTNVPLGSTDSQGGTGSMNGSPPATDGPANLHRN
jgi:hypothetical protein